MAAYQIKSSQFIPMSQGRLKNFPSSFFLNLLPTVKAVKLG